MTKRRTSLGVFLLVGFLVLFVVLLLQGSLFLYGPDRVQVVMYGQDTRFYSLSNNDGVDYYVHYSPDLKIQVPNGYGTYRVGALSKLLQYEKKPQLLSQAFSVASSSFVTYYFYPRSNEIYYNGPDVKGYRAPSLEELFFYNSNAKILDRLYLALQFLKKPAHQFEPLDIGLLTKKVQNSLYLSEEAFGKEYRGYLYYKTYRNEHQTVQIKYTNNYNTAVVIGKILEGSGIRVVDISQENRDLKKCRIVSESMPNARTVQDTARFFGCTVEKGKTDRSDIVLILGPLEKEWEL